MKQLCLRFWTQESFSLGVLCGVGYALAEQFIGNGLGMTDLPTVAAVFGAGMLRLEKKDA